MGTQRSNSDYLKLHGSHMAAVSSVETRLPSPPDQFGNDFRGVLIGEKGSDSAVCPPVTVFGLSPPSSLPLSRTSTETGIGSAPSSHAESGNASLDRPRLISGLTKREEQDAVVLDQLEVDRILQQFIKHNDCKLVRSSTELYWLPHRGIDRQLRLVDAAEFLRRLEVLRDYRLPWAKLLVDCDESVQMSIDTPTSGCPKPWSDIRRMALAGLLERYPSDDMDGLLEGIRRHLYHGQHTNGQFTPVWKKAESAPHRSESAKTAHVKEEPASDHPGKTTTKIPARALANYTKARRTSTAPASTQKRKSPATSKGDTSVAMPPSKQVKISPKSGTTKRKAPEGLEDATSIAASPSKQVRVTQESSTGKRNKTRDGSTTRVISPSERFGITIKKFFAARSPDKDDFAHFKGAILPAGGPDANLPPVDDALLDLQTSLEKQRASGSLGDTSGLHDSEIRLCQLIDMPAAQYKCQKARSFVGLATWIEYNEQRRKSERAPPARMQAFNKTQLQQCCNVDVNKASRLWIAFKAWGWFGKEDMVKTVPRVLEETFPKEYRLGWVREMQKFEKEKVPAAEWSKCAEWDLDV
ncbi:hypothetical protein PV04_04327 [Phialophora macrospora]|uniref:Uncharacterized protein n=1 Tax=Phialophora macrospora TaxID=1851006 RepID=A0A0D2G8Y6_9EURO|nr:hypothetical protein PV04_04327 [Phialophora macrospora]